MPQLSPTCLQEKGCPTNNALLINFPPELRCRIFFNKHRLSMQVGAERAKNVYATCTYSDWASILHTTIAGGWVPNMPNNRRRRKKNRWHHACCRLAADLQATHSSVGLDWLELLQLKKKTNVHVYCFGCFFIRNYDNCPTRHTLYRVSAYVAYVSNIILIWLGTTVSWKLREVAAEKKYL